jgi:hypothetical protein
MLENTQGKNPPARVASTRLSDSEHNTVISKVESGHEGFPELLSNSSSMLLSDYSGVLEGNLIINRVYQNWGKIIIHCNNKNNKNEPTEINSSITSIMLF